MDKIIHLFFGADAFRQYKQNNTKMVLAVCKPYLERVDANGRRMQGLALNSKDNNVRMCIYEGGDCYAEFSTKGSIVQRELDKLSKEGLTIHGEHYTVRLSLFGDMSFLHSVLGGSGCASNRPCILCDVQYKYLMWKPQTFHDEGVPMPVPFKLKDRTMLSHAFGQEYGLTQPYNCPRCNQNITEHCAFPPKTKTDGARYRDTHRHQHHGRPPPQQDFESICACSMHGQHNILAQTWWATITCNLWDAKTTEAVARIVNEDWKMKRFQITKNSGNKAQTKDNTPKFNGPEGRVVLQRRKEILEIVVPSTHQDRDIIHGLWEAQDAMFATWQAPAPADPADWAATGDKAQKAIETYVELFSLLTAADGTVTMHYAMFHWPDDIRKWGSLCGINAQGLEAANQEAKGDGKKHNNRQTARQLKDGAGWTRGRATQILARAVQRQVARARATSQKVLRRHVKKME